MARTPVEGGVRFDVTGDGPVADLDPPHGHRSRGDDERLSTAGRLTAEPIEGGASLTVHAPPKDAAKLKGLGFFGVMTLGMHHQMHHLMLARGQNPHE